MEAEEERAKERKKYETIAILIKMLTKTESSIKEIAATFSQVDMERQILQDKRMKQNRRLTKMPSGIGDVQRILDYGK